MSKFTDSKHYKVLQETLKWEDKIPQKGQEHLEYADYQIELKDYSKALYHYEKAWSMEVVPALYSFAFYYKKDKDIQRKYKQCYKQLYSYYVERSNQTTEDIYRLAMCCAYGVGTKVDEERAYWLFLSVGNEHGGAMYELATAFELGSMGCKKDRNQAVKWLKKSYDSCYEPAIFSHFRLSHGTFQQYPYQREIKEATSFLLGQLIRVATVSPCEDSYQRVINIYESGYPGDTAEEKIAFQQKAKPYHQYLLTCASKYFYGEFLTYKESSIHKEYLENKGFKSSGVQLIL